MAVKRQTTAVEGEICASVIPDKLFRSRKESLTLIVEDATRIRQAGPRTLTVDRMELRVARPIPDDTDIRTIQII